jgi:hypothetical protein
MRFGCATRKLNLSSLETTPIGKRVIPSSLSDFLQHKNPRAIKAMPAQPSAQRRGEPEAEETELRCADQRRVRQVNEAGVPKAFEPLIPPVLMVFGTVRAIRPVDRRVNPTAEDV